MLQDAHLPDQLAEVNGTLALLDSLAGLHNLRLESLPLVLSELLNKGILHLVKEGAIELVPLGCLQVALLQLGRLPEYVNLAPHEEVPALHR